ncbi:MAG: DegV family protein [Streptococcaceae bacterium]|jgi:DegV family protein with EDD domain|nr:DegV family protein [Streptococcaceae bacterium]
MKKIKIVTDSSAIFEDGVVENLGIEIVPLTVTVDNISYFDNDLTAEEFIKMMEKSEMFPKTSQPSIGSFVEKYDALKEFDVISIHLTRHLSGTVESARQASHISHTEVTVIDSGFIDQALAAQVIRAAKMAETGASKEEILSTLEKMKASTRLFVGISSLDNLVKGGRLSKAKGMVSNLLNIKVVLELTSTEGLVEVVKGRGNKTFSKWFDALQENLQSEGKLSHLLISHADALEIVTPFKEKISELVPDLHIPMLPTGSVIATHAGIGAFAIEYISEN